MSDRPEPAASGGQPARTAPAAAPRSRSRLFIERRRPDSVRSNPNAHWYVVATVCIGAFMGQLDASIVTLAFPTLQRDFHSSLAAVEWVSLSYLLVLISSVIAVGRMSDMVGRKLVYVWGFLLFGLASLGCGLAPSLAVLVL
ncbi:MAG: MFS transporter, partial [Frankiaceae bacterium]